MLNGIIGGKLIRPRSTRLAGDANNDGKVTGADLSILDANFGKTGGVNEGDFNGDGRITGADLSILDENFGKGTEQ